MRPRPRTPTLIRLSPRSSASLRFAACTLALQSIQLCYLKEGVTGVTEHSIERLLVLDTGGQLSALVAAQLETLAHTPLIEVMESLDDFESALVGTWWNGAIVHTSLPAGEAARAVAVVRQHAPSIPVVAINSAGCSSDAQLLMAAGASAVLAIDDLAALLQSLLPHLGQEAHLSVPVGGGPFEEDAHSREVSELTQQLADEVTKRKLAEAKVRDETEIARLVVAWSMDGICVVKHGCIVYANAELGEMMGVDSETLCGREIGHFLIEADRERVTEFCGREVEEGGAPVSTESVLHLPDEQTMEVAIRAAMATLDGAPVVVVVMRDITEVNRLRRQMVGQARTGVLQSIAQGVAHNFGVVTTAISGHAASITDSFLPSSKPYEAARLIQEAARHASHLTRQLISFSKPEGGEAVETVGSVPLGGVLQDGLSLLGHLLTERDITIEIRRATRLPSVIADESGLLDVLVNVLLNAVEAMPQGGKLSIAAVPKHIMLPRGEMKGKPGRFVVLTIRDSGIGMSREQVEKALDPFFTTKRASQALGLGLAVSDAAVQRWGGWIDLKSQRGHGTRVRIFLDRGGVPDEPEAVSGKILLVDDNRACLALMAGALEKEGFDVISALGGKEALARYDEMHEEIVMSVVDWMMPDLSGADVLAAIQERDPEAELMLISGFSRDYCRSCIPHGAWGFLQKPFKGDEVVAAVRARLSRGKQ